jgi:hypothetical protein
VRRPSDSIGLFAGTRFTGSSSSPMCCPEDLLPNLASWLRSHPVGRAIASGAAPHRPACPNPPPRPRCAASHRAMTALHHSRATPSATARVCGGAWGPAAASLAQRWARAARRAGWDEGWKRGRAKTAAPPPSPFPPPLSAFALDPVLSFAPALGRPPL